jgi:hypothetical protein
MEMQTNKNRMNSLLVIFLKLETHHIFLWNNEAPTSPYQFLVKGSTSEYR